MRLACVIVVRVNTDKLGGLGFDLAAHLLYVSLQRRFLAEDIDGGHHTLDSHYMESKVPR